MIAMIVGILISERANLMASLEEALLVCLALNISAVVLGLILAFAFKLSKIDGITLSIEVGVQNAALAMLICITFLNSPEFAVAAGVYGLTMYAGPGLLAVWSKRLKNTTKSDGKDKPLATQKA